MGKPIDLTGQKFGKWTAIERLGTINRQSYWYVVCECGSENLVSAANLKRGTTTSCGCVHSRTTHGMNKSPEHEAWINLGKRNNRPEIWNDFISFLADVGKQPSLHHRLSKRDERQPHGPNNTYWRNAHEEHTREYDYSSLTFDFGAYLRATSAIKTREVAA